ncbi:unnamed protein product, partial [Ascophyllum nodosum]
VSPTGIEGSARPREASESPHGTNDLTFPPIATVTSTPAGGTPSSSVTRTVTPTTVGTPSPDIATSTPHDTPEETASESPVLDPTGVDEPEPTSTPTTKRGMATPSSTNFPTQATSFESFQPTSFPTATPSTGGTASPTPALESPDGTNDPSLSPIATVTSRPLAVASGTVSIIAVGGVAGSLLGAALSRGAGATAGTTALAGQGQPSQLENTAA